MMFHCQTNLLSLQKMIMSIYIEESDLCEMISGASKFLYKIIILTLAKYQLSGIDNASQCSHGICRFSWSHFSKIDEFYP